MKHFLRGMAWTLAGATATLALLWLFNLSIYNGWF